MEKPAIAWHPGFYGAAEIELAENKGDLEFCREYNLGKEPLRIDLLIIKKLTDAKIRNEIGRIFKTYNVVEYKSPEDGLSIDDYYKTMGYACLYKGLGEWVDQIPAEEVTVSIFREKYPRGLFTALERAGGKIEERYEGIYYIRGQNLFETQIVVISRLEKKTHRSLKMLSKDLQKEDIEGFLEETGRLTEPGDRNNIDAVLYVSTLANWELYQKVRGDFTMFETLKILMKDELEKEKQEAVREAVQEAVREAEQEAREARKEACDKEKKMVEKMLKKGRMTVEEIADCCTELTEEEIRQMEAELTQPV